MLITLILVGLNSIGGARIAQIGETYSDSLIPIGVVGWVALATLLATVLFLIQTFQWRTLSSCDREWSAYVSDGLLIYLCWFVVTPACLAALFILINPYCD
jgi:hypothetical protein